MILKSCTEKIDKGTRYADAVVQVSVSALWVEEYNIELKVKLIRNSERWAISSIAP